MIAAMDPCSIRVEYLLARLYRSVLLSAAHQPPSAQASDYVTQIWLLGGIGKPLRHAKRALRGPVAVSNYRVAVMHDP